MNERLDWMSSLILCHWHRCCLSVVPYGDHLDPKILLEDIKPGQDNRQLSWYAIKDYQADGIEPMPKRGTFRVNGCQGVTVKPNSVCAACQRIPTMLSVKKCLLLQHKVSQDGPRSTHCLRYDCIDISETLETMRRQNWALIMAKSQLFFMRSRKARLQIHVRSLRKKLTEFATRGNFRAITHKIWKAGEEGKFADKQVLLDTIQTVANNLNVKPRRKRFQISVRQFYETILILGDPWLAPFVSENMDGPDIHTIYGWRQRNIKKVLTDASTETFIQLTNIHKDAKAKADITTPIPVLTAEDETVIKAEVSYILETDKLLGFCGKMEEPGKVHQCLMPIRVVVGDDKESYTRMIEAFNTTHIGMQARVVLLNPLHRHLLKIAVAKLKCKHPSPASTSQRKICSAEEFRVQALFICWHSWTQMPEGTQTK